MNKKGLAWLYEELPELVGKGVLSPKSAEKLREYYGPLSQNVGRRMLYIVFGLVGAIMLGLGVILILGHNWDQLSRFTRLMIVVGMLAAAQTATGLVLWRKNDSRAWREGTAAFQTLAVGAAIVLVGQTYHLVDDFKNFMLTWLLLSLPLVYLLEVKGVAGMYLVGVMVWLASVQQLGATRLIAWPLFFLVLPYCWRQLKYSRYANSTGILSWLVVICFFICFGLTWDIRLWALLYAPIFADTYFIGLLWFDDLPRTWQNPFKIIGLTGGLFIAYLLSFSGGWHYFIAAVPTIARSEYLIAFGLLVLAIILAVRLFKKGCGRAVLLGAVPVLAWAGYLLHLSDRSGVYSAVLLNLYLLAVSVSVIMEGVRRTRLSMLNGGMLMLSALILSRFFDFSYSFLARGVAFILLGLVFLIVNLIMSRRKEEVPK